MPALNLTINIKSPLSLEFSWSNKQNFNQGIKPPTIMGRIYIHIYIYIHQAMVIYILKPPLYWEQLNHTKDNQSSNTRKQAGCLMDNANIYSFLRNKDWYKTN